MSFTLWYLVIGALLISLAMGGSAVQRLPLTTTLLYLGVGFALGPAGYGVIQLDPVEHAELLERVTEVSVIISLFATGLKLRTPCLMPAGVWWRDLPLAP